MSEVEVGRWLNKERKKYREPLNTVNLSETRWEQNKDRENAFSFEEEVEIEGEDFILAGKTWSSIKGGVETTSFVFEINKDEDSSPLVTLAIILKNNPEAKVIEAEDLIMRTDQNKAHKAPRGSGVLLVKKGFEFINGMQTEKPIHHVARAVPGDMDLDRWKERFGPLLTEYGYQQTSENTWERTFVPRKEEAA